MVKRFLTVFGLVLLYMLAWAVCLVPVILVAGDNDTVMLVVVLGTLVFSTAGLVPYLDWDAKRVFRFQGEGEPVSGAELRAQVQAINDFDVPVMVKERRGWLVATWRYVDARWWEILMSIMNSILQSDWDVRFGIW